MWHWWHRRTREESDLDEEIRFHLAEEAKLRVDAGMDADAAHASARRAFGNVTLVTLVTRGTWGRRLLDAAAQDVRSALRTWRRSPGFLAVAVLTLGLGIGATTTLFSLVSGILIAPLPYRDADRLVVVRAERDYDGTRQPVRAPFFNQTVAAWPSDWRTFDGTTFYSANVAALTTDAGAELVDEAIVTSSFFEIVDGDLMLGRGLTHADDLQPTVVISTRLWQRIFAGAADVVGQTITLNGELFTIAGVASRTFQIPGASTDVWVPAGFAQARNTRCCSFTAIGRLAPGATAAAATEEMAAVARSLAAEHSSLEGVRVQVVGLHDLIESEARPALLMLTAASCLLLVLACANVMNLLLVRHTARTHETAVRRALGASRGRLVALALAESAVLAAIATGLGVALATTVVRILKTRLPAAVPRLDAVQVDGTVLGFAVCAAALSTLAIGLLPALRSDDMLAGLRAGRRGATTSGRARAALRTASVVQLAISVVLLVGAALLGRSLVALLHTDLGITTDRVATASLNLSMNRALTDDQQVELVGRVVDRIASLPHVTAAGVGSARPPDASRMVVTLNRPGRPDGGDAYRAVAVPATPGYFHALGVRLERGRLFADSDDALAPPVVILSADTARRLFHGEDPLGRTIRLPWVRDGRNVGAEMTVVGITANVKYSGLDAEADDLVYRPFAQQAHRAPFLVARTTGDPAVLAGQLRGEIGAVDPAIVVADVATLDDVLADVTSSPRFRTFVLTGFAAMALIIAGVGLYGVIAYSVSQRTGEIGIRMTLGADGRRIRTMVLREGLVLGLVGTVAGAIAAWSLTHLLVHLLYGIAPTDPTSFALAVGGIVTACLVASYVPAARAARTDPVVVLRES